MKVEYRVISVTRYAVTRYEEGEQSAASRQVGEYGNAEMAYEVGYALAKAEHQRLGYPPGDERIQYPENPFIVKSLNNRDDDGSSVYSTVHELIESLRSFHPQAVPFTIEPPFTGVKVVPSNSKEFPNGAVLLAQPRRLRKDEDVYGRPQKSVSQQVSIE
jgi:hypothetical protein